MGFGAKPRRSDDLERFIGLKSRTYDPRTKFLWCPDPRTPRHRRLSRRTKSDDAAMGARRKFFHGHNSVTAHWDLEAERTSGFKTKVSL